MVERLSLVIILVLTMIGCKILPEKQDKESHLKEETQVINKENPSKWMAQSYFEQGMSYYLEGQMDKAIKSFAEALKLDPEHPKARKMFEEALKKRVETKEEPKREESKKEVLPQPQDLTSTKVEEEPKEEKKEEEKKEVLSKDEEIPREKLPPPEKEEEKPIVEKISKDELNWFEFVKELNRRGMFDDAISELDRLLDKYPNTLLIDKIIYTRAETYIAKKEYQAAEKDFNTIIDDYPKSPLVDDAKLMVANINLLRMEYDEALLKYLRLVRELKDILGRIPLQEVAKEKELTPIPQSKEVLIAKAQLGVAECYRLKKNYLDALIEYYEVIRSYSDKDSCAQALYYIGYIYDFINEVRDFKRAVAAYSQVIKNYPDSIWASYAKERKEYIEKNYL